MAEGEGAELPGGPAHLAAQVASRIAGHDRLEVRMRSEIPVARGLAPPRHGCGCRRGSGSPTLSRMALPWTGTRKCGSLGAGWPRGCGGCGGPPGRPAVRLDPALRFVVIVPDRELPTASARDVLPASVTYYDAAFNLGRLTLLIAGLADESQLLAIAGDDRLHQGRALSSSRVPGALGGSATSRRAHFRAGPVLALACSGFAATKSRSGSRRGESIDREHGAPGNVLLLEADLPGVKVEEIA